MTVQNSQNPAGLTRATSLGMSLIRILAALGVMFGHNFGFCGLTVFRNQDVFPYMQNIGVVLLFLLAGFFTAFSLDQKRGKDYRFPEFVLDRYVRLTVTLLPAIVLVAAMDFLVKLRCPKTYGFLGAFNIKTLVGNLLFLQDVPNATSAWVTSFASARPFWTLAVEWWIYVAVGYACLVIIPRVRERRVTTWSVLVGAMVSYPALNFLVGGRGNGLMFTFLLGVLIYVLHNRQKKFSSTVNGIGLLLSLEAMIIAGTQIKEAYNLLFVLLCALVVYFTAALGACVPDDEAKKESRVNRIMRFLADGTYPLYLVHYTVMATLQMLLPTTVPPVIRFWMAIVISCALAVVLTVVFERRSKQVANWIKKKFREEKLKLTEAQV